ncbi:hypothetical protein K449DRAFT_451256 [Hypoxylon sp. EC38]|nr:hypothetical protein K449DRAFT_451256 [Hypoxylon sp. EC38]
MAITAQIFEGIGITLLLITTSFVSMRLLVSIRSFNKLDLGDSLLCTTASFATTDRALRVLSLWTSKISIFFIYIKIFGVHKWLRYASWIAVVITGLSCPMSQPERLNEWAADCIRGTIITGVAFGFLSIFTDAMILCLPIPVIYQLQLDLSKKIALSSVFFTGIMATVASIVSLYYKWASLNAWATEFSVPLLCNTIECSIATMAGCAPAVKAFWGIYISKREPTNTTSTPASKTGVSRLYGVYSSNSSKRNNGPADIEGSYMMIDHPERGLAEHEGFERVSSTY